MTPFEARSALWEAMEAYRKAPSPATEQATHSAIDGYELAINTAPKHGPNLAIELGDVMTSLENGTTFADWSQVKAGLAALTTIQREVFTNV